MSLDGARVQMWEPVTLPERPMLLNHQTGDVFECDVRWQRGKEAGVYFLDLCSRAARRAIVEKYGR